MSHYLQDLLAEVFRAEGSLDPDRTAARALEALQRVEVLPAAEVERFERDARVYELRGQGLRPSQLVDRFGISRGQVFKMIRRHGQRRRAVLRFVS